MMKTIKLLFVTGLLALSPQIGAMGSLKNGFRKVVQKKNFYKALLKTRFNPARQVHVHKNKLNYSEFNGYEQKRLNQERFKQLFETRTWPANYSLKVFQFIKNRKQANIKRAATIALHVRKELGRITGNQRVAKDTRAKIKAIVAKKVQKTSGLTNRQVDRVAHIEKNKVLGKFYWARLKTNMNNAYSTVARSCKNMYMKIDNFLFKRIGS